MYTCFSKVKSLVPTLNLDMIVLTTKQIVFTYLKDSKLNSDSLPTIEIKSAIDFFKRELLSDFKSFSLQSNSKN